MAADAECDKTELLDVNFGASRMGICDFNINNFSKFCKINFGELGQENIVGTAETIKRILIGTYLYMR